MQGREQKADISYKGKPLTLYRAKDAGKNRGKYDGFYKTEDGGDYFVKQPDDKSELFTELFAGKLIEKFKQYGYIKPVYHESLICADWIKIGDSYGLIQPTRKFEELFRLMDGQKTGKDRSVAYEIMFGVGEYAKVFKQYKTSGLSISLLYSLILGDYSVHSGNMIAITKALQFATETETGDADEKEKFDETYHLIGRIDWGAAFRDFGHADNNKNILVPKEYVGILNYKKITKNYIYFFAGIPGLFNNISKLAEELKSELLQGDRLKNIISEVLNDIPMEMFSEEEKKNIADYIRIEEFQFVRRNDESADLRFAEKMAGFIAHRIEKIAAIRMASEKSEEELHKSFMVSSGIFTRKRVNLKLSKSSTFSDAVHELSDQFAKSKVEETDFSEESAVKITMGIDQDNIVDDMVVHFNEMLNQLLTAAGLGNFWNCSSLLSENMLSEYHDIEDRTAKDGYAFIPQYKESVILKRMFGIARETGLDAETETKKAFYVSLPQYANALSEYANKNPESHLLLLCNTLEAGRSVIDCLKQLCDLQSVQRELAMDMEASLTNLSKSSTLEAEGDIFLSIIKGLIHQLKINIELFMQYYNFLGENLRLNREEHSDNGSAFYEITTEALEDFSPDQLMTVCLEEVGRSDSIILDTVLKSDGLYSKLMEAAERENKWICRSDQPIDKIASIKEMHNKLQEERKREEARRSLEAEQEEMRRRIEEEQERLRLEEEQVRLRLIAEEQERSRLAEEPESLDGREKEESQFAEEKDEGKGDDNKNGEENKRFTLLLGNDNQGRFEEDDDISEEDKNFAILAGIQKLIMEKTDWNVTVGGRRIYFTNKDGEIISKMSVPKGVKRILDEIEKAVDKKSTATAAFEQVKRIIIARCSDTRSFILNWRGGRTKLFYAELNYKFIKPNNNKNSKVQKLRSL